jgi:hypothetical protein
LRDVSIVDWRIAAHHFLRWTVRPNCSSIGAMLAGARLVPPAALLSLLGANLAYAQLASFPVDLTWSAPAECPPREAVLDEVARLLAAAHERAHATARADVVRDERGRWHAALSVDARDAHGERVLEADGCSAIASATALIIAVAVEGGILPQQTAPPPVETAPAPLAAALPPTPPASQLIIAAAGVIDDGLLPSLAPGGELSIGWAYKWSTWRIRAMASGSLFADQTVAGTGATGRFTPLAVVARACASIVRGPFDVGPCLGAELDIMGGTAVDPSVTPNPGIGTWGSVSGSLLASLTFSRHVAAFLRADGRLSPSPPPFGIAEHSVVGTITDIPTYTPAQLSARAALGLEVRFF